MLFAFVRCALGWGGVRCVAGKLQELNSMVTVKVHSGELTEAIVGQHGVVVMCNRPVGELLRWDTFCHQKVRRPSC